MIKDFEARYFKLGNSIVVTIPSHLVKNYSSIKVGASAKLMLEVSE